MPQVSAFTLMLAVGAGGGVGALARFGGTLLIRSTAGLPWWVATMTVNLVGCYLIGLAWAWLEAADHPGWYRPLIVTGLLGGFTTFSTFSLEAIELIDGKRWFALFLCVGGSVLLGLLAVRLGLATRLWTAS